MVVWERVEEHYRSDLKIDLQKYNIFTTENCPLITLVSHSQVNVVGLSGRQASGGPILRKKRFSLKQYTKKINKLI